MRTSFQGKARMFAPLALIGAAALAAFSGSKKAGAADPNPAEKQERCAQRVSIAILGQSPAADLVTGDAQAQVETLLTRPEFIDRFARFTNAKFNAQPGNNAEQDSAFYLSKYILETGKPWKDLFAGGYDVAAADPTKPNQDIRVTEKADGLGFFRSKAWMDRYAGNELAGLKLATAYRIMNNAVGLTLVASTNSPDTDVTAAGRQAAPCNQCHFQGWSALDNIAQTLPRVKRQGGNTTYEEPATKTPVKVNGMDVSDDKSLVAALVSSEQFNFRACRLAFEFLYGRSENVCEGTVFDKCVDAFKAKGTMQSAIAAVAKDATFCQ